MDKLKRTNFKDYLPEYATEIGIILLSLGLYAFFKLAGGVSDGNTSDFDERVLLWFRNPSDFSDPLGPVWLEVVVRDITALGGLLILGLMCLAACGYLWIKGKHKLALFVALSASSGSVLNGLLKELFSRPRPDIVPHETAAAFSSFPSGHAMMSAVVYLTLGALLSMSTDELRIKVYTLTWSVFLTALVGISRIYLGVHWPTDIIAGWIAGAAWALLSLLAARRLFA